MKNLPVHKLLYPALAAAALLSAASAGLFAATFQNYDECRCAPGPNNSTTYTWDKCCANSAWVSDYAQKSNCCANSTAFKNNAANGCVTCVAPKVDVGGGVCKTPCGACSGVKVRDYSVLYSEDGICCVLPPPNPVCPAGAQSNCCGVGVWNSQTCTCDCSGWKNHDGMGTTYVWDTTYNMCCPYKVVGACINCI